MPKEKTAIRGSFSGKIGFIMAAAGSAVGLGNIWRFPYLAAKYGGGIFLLVYIVLTVTFGFALMITEIAIGRKTGLSTIGAYEALCKKYKFLGIIASITPLIVFPYYCVIGGWVVKYLFVYATGAGKAATQADYFQSFIGSVSPVFWLAVFMGLSAVVVMFGVEKGIEKVSKIFMPVLVVLTVFIAIYTVTLDGALDGLLYYITPDYSNFSVTTVIAAMGQIFYSMSLSMGVMITYGSYMKKDINIEKSVSMIELFDTGIAIVSGMMIVPAVFAFSGGDASKMTAGSGLMFETLPKVFDTMFMGNIIGFVFFVLVLVAALTSAISMMETIVSIFSDKLKTSRRNICIGVILVCFIIALPVSLGFGVLKNILPLGMTFLDFYDFISNSLLMPFVALLTCILIGYICGVKTITDEVELNSRFRRKRLYIVMIKYIAPVFTIMILITSILESLNIIKV